MHCKKCKSKKLKKNDEDLKESLFVCEQCGMIHNHKGITMTRNLSKYNIELPAYVCVDCKSIFMQLEIFGAGDSGREIVCICPICNRVNTTQGKGKYYPRYPGKKREELPAYFKNNHLVLMKNGKFS